MAKAKDFLLNDNYEPVIKDGDFVIGDSDQQHVQLILISDQGNWRNAPLTGVGIRNWQSAPVSALERNKLKRRIQSQLEDDGYKVNEIRLQSFENITIDCMRP